MSELPPLFPLLLKSLTHQDAELNLSTLEALKSVGTDAPEIIEAHLQPLVKSLLDLLSSPKMVVRRACLSLLRSLSRLSAQKVSLSLMSHI